MEPAAIAGLATLWTHTLGDPRISIAVLDGPVDTAHPSLAGAELTVLETLACAHAGHGAALSHGTFTASVIFGQPALSAGCEPPHASGSSAIRSG